MMFQIAGMPWESTEVVSIISAVEMEFPPAIINGCYFYYTKRIWGTVGEFGLNHTYKNHQNCMDIFRKVMALGLLALNFVSGCMHVNTDEWISKE